ncbi:CoA-transferase family III protein [Bordetella bronchiseptica MBORD675]|uniref:CaiB/BaiF CoA transferase family protein n=1 Tax=Bordetella bronchiseptica TaxID=518 RepID=UPI00028FB29E|nr:CaiB/BaiF CoA-transferase family protein [Bordetella bronchiseptica]AUL17592.1 carnitine dehydratase [Bordetella bronchiseptica]AWP60831.1 CoA transferase [Bordetella bronchiseptica]KAK69797.1 CoA-transferase family III protein [Bordetella bronchiseptica MO211]KAK73966.1 CoA-transferase family III protein [Bordetella bronchiseptica CA90 BB02]KDC16884.1 CoA-transferase family III protein [Bordetella bronchiseptica F-1]
MGPLAGLKVVEFPAIGPAPMCAMLLADMGATVIRLERQQPSADLGVERPLKYNLLLRNRPGISVDLKAPEGVQFAQALLESADVLLEGFRPGTMERMGFGPDACLQQNPRLVYGRMTGWGQTGPYAAMAGHDLNYIAMTGALDAIGRKGQPPTPPLNLVGDFGGGALYLAMGVLAAVFAARGTGKGQVVDAAMVDGAASLMTPFFGMAAAGLFNAERGTNVLDSGAPYYDVYRCADGKYLSIAPIESRFRRIFFERLGLDAPAGDQRADWDALREAIAARIATRTQAQWCECFDGTDACVAPVLSIAEAPSHPHNQARATFLDIDGVVQPAPAPRFGATPLATPRPPEPANSRFEACLGEWGMSAADIARWKNSAAIGAAR